MKVAMLTGDNREAFKDYAAAIPYFGTAPEALLQGMAAIPEFEVHVITCTQKPMKSPEKLYDNTYFHSLYVPKIGWMRTSYQGCLRSIRRLLKQLKPDIVHGQGSERECAVSAAFSRFPNVVTIHGNMAEIARLFKARMGTFGWLAGQLEGIALSRTMGVFCNSAYTEGLVAPRTKKTWRVTNALREEFFKPPAAAPAANDKCVLLNVGVISERKRQVELLEQAEKWHAAGLKFELQFIGQADDHDPYVAKFLEKMKEGVAKGYARHSGFTKSTAELIARFDAAHGLIHCPSEEAFGLVVAEAMARELKFFGSQAGGIVDIATGVPGAELFGLNEWDPMSAAIMNWMRAGHPRVSGAAQVMNEKYHPRVIAQKHLEIYREVLAKPS